MYVSSIIAHAMATLITRDKLDWPPLMCLNSLHVDRSMCLLGKSMARLIVVSQCDWHNCGQCGL